MNRNGCPYAVLGVPRNCTAKEVNSAWRKLSLQCHPDRLKDDDPELQRQYKVRFQCITEAKNQLLAKLPADEPSRVQRAPAAKQPANPWVPKWQPRSTSAPKSYAYPNTHSSKHSTSAPFHGHARHAHGKENEYASGSTGPGGATHSRSGVPPAMRFPIPKDPQPAPQPAQQAHPKSQSASSVPPMSHPRGMFIPQHEKFIPTHRARSPPRSAPSNNNSSNSRHDAGTGAERVPPLYKVRQPSPEAANYVNTGPAHVFPDLDHTESEPWPEEDPLPARVNRMRPQGKASGKGCGPSGSSAHPDFRWGGPGDVPSQHQPKRPPPPHFNSHNGAPHYNGDGGLDDRQPPQPSQPPQPPQPPQQPQPLQQPNRGGNGLSTNMMDLLDDDLTMPDPTTRKKTAAVNTARRPTGVPPPSGSMPYQRTHSYPHQYARSNGGQTQLYRNNVHEFSQFLNMSYNLGKIAREKRNRAAAQQARARPQTQQQVPPVQPPAKGHGRAKPMGSPEVPNAAQKDGGASSSAVSDDTSDVDETSSAPSVVSPQLATAEDHCAPTQKVETNFDMFSDCAPSSSSNGDPLHAAAPAESEEVIIADDSPVPEPGDQPGTTHLLPDSGPASSRTVPLGTAAAGDARPNNVPTAPCTEVNVSDNSDATSVLSSSSGTSPSSRREVPGRAAPSSSAPPQPPRPARHVAPASNSGAPKESPAVVIDTQDSDAVPASASRKRAASSAASATTKDAPDPSTMSPKSISSSSPSVAGTKRRRTSRSKMPGGEDEEVSEHSLPACVKVTFLMQRFSLDKEDAEIVRRTILQLRACGKPEGLRVRKISKGYNPRWIELLKSLPIFDVRIDRSTRSNKCVHKVRLFDARKAAANPTVVQERSNSAEGDTCERTSFVAISSDEDDFGTILRRSGQHVLPWTYEESGDSQV